MRLPEQVVAALISHRLVPCEKWRTFTHPFRGVLVQKSVTNLLDEYTLWLIPKEAMVPTRTRLTAASPVIPAA